jgi:hypothetical protein
MNTDAGYIVIAVLEFLGARIIFFIYHNEFLDLTSPKQNMFMQTY